MRTHVWEGVIPQRDLEIYAKAGFGRKGGLGKRPGIVIIDIQYRTVGLTRAPILEAMDTYPTACGEAGWRAVDATRQLLDVTRPLEVPVFYPHVSPEGGLRRRASGWQGPDDYGRQRAWL